MREERLSEWLSGREATAIISANSGHDISQRYIRWLAMNGYITTRVIDGRTKLYLRSDVEAYVVDTKRGPKPRHVKHAKEAA